MRAAVFKIIHSALVKAYEIHSFKRLFDMMNLTFSVLMRLIQNNSAFKWYLSYTVLPEINTHITSHVTHA